MRMPEVAHSSPAAAEDFRRVLDGRAVQPVFQPLIDLDSRHVVGYEALARGPTGSSLESPAALFAAAWRAGRVAELDWACRAAAFGAAAAVGVGVPDRCALVGMPLMPVRLRRHPRPRPGRPGRPAPVPAG